MIELTPEQLARLQRLRVPVEAHYISRLPKPYSKDAPKSKCNECGGYHGQPAVHLDYVGHAATTHMLLEADAAWSWEPLAMTPEGLPKLDSDGGLWIKLTVAGVTRLGYGDAGQKKGPDAMKERIGDAIRNAAMRFGVALELWHKGVLHMEGPEEEEEPAKFVLSQDWHAAVKKATTQEALQFVWETGVKEYDKLGDRELYNAFKKEVGARKAELSA